MSTLNGTASVTLDPASNTNLGGVQVQSSSGILVDNSGNISVDPTQFLSVANAESTYATQSSIVDFVTSTEVGSDISTALASFTPMDIINVINLVVPNDWPMYIESGSYVLYNTTNVELDNVSTIFIVNNPTYSFQY